MELVKKDDYFERNANGTQGTMKRKGGFNEALSTYSNNKGKRTIAVQESIVTINGIEYDGDEVSTWRLSNVATIAHFRYIKAISEGVSVADAYQAVYKDTKVTWIGVDNNPHTIQIESIVEVLDSSMTEISNLWMDYR